jgi:carbonic anhydrase
MAAVETLLQRNESFATERFPGDLPVIPLMKAMVITCADPRVDPAHILGLQLGEAGVIRNVGGRITPAAMQTLAMLAAVAASEDASGGWELVVLQHTDCGITRLVEYTDVLADYFGVAEAELPAKAVTDPRRAVATDVAALKANPLLPAALVVSGLMYDVRTGRVETVVEPGPLRDE